MIHALYIDDECDTDVFQTTKDLLASYGVTIDAIADVGDVLPRLAQRVAEVDLIILDIMMPSGDTYSLEETTEGTTTGVSLLRDIRAQYPDIPVIVVSGRAKNQAERWVAEFRVSQYLRKPASVKSIADAAKAAVGSGTAR